MTSKPCKKWKQDPRISEGYLTLLMLLKLIKISINATAAEFICKNIFPHTCAGKKYIKNKIASFCSCADRFVSYLVGKFSHDMVHLISPSDFIYSKIAMIF